MKATLLIHEKFVFEDEAIVEIKAWQVPMNPRHPEGYKYSLVYIDSKHHRTLGYDNSKGQGHHRHFQNKWMPVIFQSIDDLIRRFLKEVKQLRGE